MQSKVNFKKQPFLKNRKRKLLNQITCIIFSILFFPSACKNQTPCENPKEVIESFFEAVENGDTEFALKMLDEQSKKKLEEISKVTFSKTGLKMQINNFILPYITERKGSISKVEIKDVNKTSERSKEQHLVIYFKDGTTQSVPVIKEENCFKISFVP